METLPREAPPRCPHDIARCARESAGQTTIRRCLQCCLGSCPSTRVAPCPPHSRPGLQTALSCGRPCNTSTPI